MFVLVFQDIEQKFQFQVDKSYASWYKNAAGLYHSHKHGFGLLDAWKLVAASQVRNHMVFFFDKFDNEKK